MSKITLELPQTLLETIQQQASASDKTVSEYVADLIGEKLPSPVTKTSQVDSFHQEVAAFENLKSDLLKRYAGQFVAIYQGQVVGYGEDETVLFRQMLARYGAVPCYIEKVAPETPRRARMPSIRVKAA